MEINKENIKNPTSLYREDNPALFDAIVKSAELESIGNELTQQQLEKITKLTVDNNIGSAYGFNEKGEYVELTGRISRGDLPPSLTTLNGLEKLKNLESFKVVVKERYLNIDEYFYEYSRYLERMYEPEYKNKIEEMVFTTLNKVLKRDYHNTEEFKKAQAEVFKNFEKYDKFNQITDFTALSQCKKLKKLDLSRQRYLTSLDLYNLKNLSSLDLSNCENLSDIYNLSELNAFREDGQSTTININFGDCYKLINISDIDKLSKQLAQNEYNKDNCTVIVPTTSFCHLSKKYPEAMQLLNKISQSDKSRDVFLWTEAWDSVRQCSKINTEQMQILKNRANEIVRSFHADAFSI